MASRADLTGGWLKANAGDVAAQFGITVRQLEGVITNYQSAYTTGVAQVLLIGAIVARRKDASFYRGPQVPGLDTQKLAGAQMKGRVQRTFD